MRQNAPEGLAVSESDQRRLGSIGSVERHSVAPPDQDARLANCAILGVVQAEEDDDNADSDTRVKRSGQHVCNNRHQSSEKKSLKPKEKKRTVVLGPPGKVTATNDVVEEEPDDRPGNVVGRGRGRDETGATEDDGPVDVLEDRVVELVLEEAGEDGREEADEEEEDEAVVDLPLRELARGADDTPDNGCRAEHLRRGASEAVLLCRVAHILDVREHPRLHTELDGTSDDGGDDLGPEHGAGAGSEVCQ